MMRFKELIGVYILALAFLGSSIKCENRHETEVFGKWHAWQQIYRDHPITCMSDKLNDVFVKQFKEEYEQSLPLLKKLIPLISSITNNNIHEYGFQLQPPLDEHMRENLEYIYNQIETNLPGFVDYLIESGLTNEKINIEEQDTQFNITIEKYKAFLRLLFPVSDSFYQSELIMSFGSRLFEYCYSDETFPHYQGLFTNPAHHPAARLINTLIWYILVGDGWKHWHENVIKVLKEKAAQGHEILYVAGGTDFYQLLRKGIYNITIIDPFLPTQQRFYSEGWMFLLVGNDGSPGIDDEIRFGPECDSIKMKRVDFQESEQFSFKLSNNQIIEPKKSITTWYVYDRNNQHIGHVIIHRRSTIQDDFAPQENTTLVMSYDELVYIAAPDQLDGWGIDPTQIDPDLEIYVKQTREPIYKNELCNIRIASLLNLSCLRYINLSSDPK